MTLFSIDDLNSLNFWHKKKFCWLFEADRQACFKVNFTKLSLILKFYLKIIFYIKWREILSLGELDGQLIKKFSLDFVYLLPVFSFIEIKVLIVSLLLIFKGCNPYTFWLFGEAIFCEVYHVPIRRILNLGWKDHVKVPFTLSWNSADKSKSKQPLSSPKKAWNSILY